MDCAFLAIINHRGLRILLPEDDQGYRTAAELLPVLAPAVCYWLTLSTDDAGQVLREISTHDYDNAFRLAWNQSAHLGPIATLHS